MRTYLLAGLNRKISTADRNLTQLMFVSEQFLIDNRSRIDSEPDEFTRNVHSKNPYRNEFNYRLSQIQDELANLRLSTFTGTLVFAYSLYESYTKDLLELVQKLRAPSRNRLNKEPLIDFMFAACLNTSTQKHLQPEEIDTLDYIRLRRNVVVHAEGNLSPALEKLVRRGANLNAFWQGFGLRALDFTSQHVGQFSMNETIDLLRLMRDIASKIDHHALNSIGKQNIVTYATTDFKTRFGKEIANQRRSKVEGRFLRDVGYRFDLEPADVDLSKIAF